LVAVFPVSVLLLVLITFLRYQSELITRMQQFWVFLDLLALVWFFHRAPFVSATRRESRLAEAKRWANLVWLPGIVMGLTLVYLNVVTADADIKMVRPEEPSHQLPSLAIAQIDVSLLERTRHHIADVLNAPLDVVLCPSLRWGCRYLRVDHRTLVDHVWNDKAMAD
jgi:hypothetical protein